MPWIGVFLRDLDILHPFHIGGPLFIPRDGPSAAKGVTVRTGELAG